MESQPEYYALLDISPNADPDEIGRAYRRLAFQFHPDRNGESEEANKRMEEINEAYAVLSDPVKRRQYDLPRGYGRKVPRFKRGGTVRVSANSPSPYRGQAGVVDREPISDAFRFWYSVRIESKGLATVGRFAEEELEGLRNWQ